ncbi:DUF2239 family protein [Deinococcus hopiensis]|uniref:DUF2239 family protein n=1 Tax=Deinococcus hopiensis KR-140 TaxID=695939 RepID=A0A1W1UDL3_9DEIO|nr:DUF2239 family protein [Deinococcus hopiensis]SMB78911.1 hypothetical protein SAMN00790413_05688 [Deinococcus hopiensis KR-140]
MSDATHTAFHGSLHLATAPLPELLGQLEARRPTLDLTVPLLVFDDRTGRTLSFDWREGEDVPTLLGRILPPPQAPQKPVGRGRPRLGVVAREVTLLPRHWEWLEAQPNGASAALRRLIDEARRREPEREQVLASQTAADRFMVVLAGDLHGYQEAARALYARDPEAFDAATATWPPDVRAHARSLAHPALGAVSEVNGTLPFQSLAHPTPPSGEDW